MPPSALLDVHGLSKEFGGVGAVTDVSFAVRERQIKAMIGPNGAGKTTIFNVITGVLPPSRGTVWFKGQPLTGLRPPRIASLGIARTFQTAQLFGEMTVLENVMLGRHPRTRSGVLASALRTRAMRREEAEIRERSAALLETVGLAEKAGQVAASLPYGEQRLTEIARALAMEPVILLLDEPAAGLNRQEKAKLADLILRLRGQGITLLLVDHHMDLVMGISDEVVVLYYGEKIAEGAPDEVRRHAAVLAAYLGEEE
ncbi:MAG: ABC transporter ATP-binding protein [Candidatus Rokubacteria bacterium]|nr:ABC transporter ATP-binding protein [Candidatus Rokubacteria bacterium]